MVDHVSLRIQKALHWLANDNGYEIKTIKKNNRSKSKSKIKDV